MLGFSWGQAMHDVPRPEIARASEADGTEHFAKTLDRFAMEVANADAFFRGIQSRGKPRILSSNANRTMIAIALQCLNAS